MMPGLRVRRKGPQQTLGTVMRRGIWFSFWVVQWDDGTRTMIDAGLLVVVAMPD